MPDITLTITLDEQLARHYAARNNFGLSPDVMAVRKAIAVALPPEMPKEGEVWRNRLGDHIHIGPTWGGRTMCRLDGAGDVFNARTATIAEEWTKVR